MSQPDNSISVAKIRRKSETTKDKEKKNLDYLSISAQIAAPIKIGEEGFVCNVIIRRDAGTNKFYLHEVTAQKKLLDAVFVTNSGSNPSAHLGDVAKVQQNFETTKDLAKKNCLLSYHSALIAGASVKAA